YNRFRYYDAEAGQYVSPDPIRLDGGTRLLGYVDNPNIFFDLFGLAGCSETDAEKSLQEMQRKQGIRSHFFDRHGAHTTLQDQQLRATTGYTPDGKQGRPVDSSRFLTHVDQLEAAQHAIDLRSRFNANQIEFDMGRPIGEGYLKGGQQYIGGTQSVRAYFDANGNLTTLFPLLR
ncbi:RHS repeat-associated core domain-containing protein, partial [Methylobacterium indicum]